MEEGDSFTSQRHLIVDGAEDASPPNSTKKRKSSDSSSSSSPEDSDVNMTPDEPVEYILKLHLKESTTEHEIMDIFADFDSCITESIRVNQGQMLAFIHFYNESDREQAMNIDTSNLKFTISEERPQSDEEQFFYYRAHLCTNKKYPDGADPLKDAQARLKNININVSTYNIKYKSEKMHFSIYLKNYDDWNQLLERERLARSDPSLPIIYAKRYLFATNDSSVFKGYVSGIPPNWKSLALRNFLHTKMKNVISAAPARIPGSNISRRFGFFFTKSIDPFESFDSRTFQFGESTFLHVSKARSASQ